MPQQNHAIGSQPIQKGTKRPLGNREKTSKRPVKAKIFKKRAGTCQGEELCISKYATKPVAIRTSINAARSAIQSSDLRQRIIIATLKHISSEMKVKTRV